MKIQYDPEVDGFYNASRIQDLWRVISALNTLGTLNKAIRKEVRATFWSLAAFTFQPGLQGDFLEAYTACTPHYMSLLEHFMRGLGDDGRFGIRKLVTQNFSGCPECGLIPLAYSEAGYSSFNRTVDMLIDCTSLTELRMTVREHYLFREEQAGLEEFFLHGQELRSKGLEKFQALLRSLPKLRAADIDVLELGSQINNKGHRGPGQDLAPFLRFAFTGKRRIKLWITAKVVLQATVLKQASGRVTVNYQGRGCMDHIEREHFYVTLPLPSDEERDAWILDTCDTPPGDYEKWLEARSGKITGEDGDGGENADDMY
jgi:hypothetical protein